MNHANILEPVNPIHSTVEWASPIVPVLKPDNRVRISDDFKCIVNPHLIEEEHSLPTFEEVTNKLAGFTEFRVIDLKDAFLRIPVNEHSRKALVIGTHRGYFRYDSLPYGLNILPLIFQRYMDTLLYDIDNVAWYEDDIALGGKTHHDHLNRLHHLLTRLQSVGPIVQESKLQILKSKIRYLHHLINASGIQTIADNFEAFRCLTFFFSVV